MSVSSTSSSSSHSILAIPKPTQDRIPLHTPSSSVKYPQSAPMNVPVMSSAMMKAKNQRLKFDEIDDDDDEGEDEVRIGNGVRIGNLGMRLG